MFLLIMSLVETWSSTTSIAADPQAKVSFMITLPSPPKEMRHCNTDGHSYASISDALIG